MRVRTWWFQRDGSGRWGLGFNNFSSCGDAVEGGERALSDGILGGWKSPSRRNGLLLRRAITFASDVIDIPPAKDHFASGDFLEQICFGGLGFVLVLGG